MMNVAYITKDEVFNKTYTWLDTVCGGCILWTYKYR